MPTQTSLPDPITKPVGSQVGRSVGGTMWQTALRPISLDRPVVAGILNVTPDSFSDGGRFLELRAALAHVESMVAAGATMIDIGAESTRPGRPNPVPIEEEWNRLAPVLIEVVRQFPDIAVSVDTVKAQVARRALEHGAWIVNDVSGLRLDPEMASVCSAGSAGVVIMHSRGTVQDMATYDHADYDDVIREVLGELSVQIDVALRAGTPRGAIVIDPGLGFAKRPEHNLAVLRDLPVLGDLGYPIMVGPSRKRFLREMVGGSMDLVDDATAAACVCAYERGACLFRVHDVEKTGAALAVARAIRG